MYKLVFKAITVEDEIFKNYSFDDEAFPIPGFLALRPSGADSGGTLYLNIDKITGIVVESSEQKHMRGDIVKPKMYKIKEC